jgi:cytochrome c556
MNRKHKFALALLALVLTDTVAAQGLAAVDANPDKRMYLRLLPEERDLVLQEMRSFLHVLQTIAEGLARNDMDAVAAAARSMGSGAANEIPPHVVAKLPEDFKRFAGTVHTTFDVIALDAQDLGDTTHTLTQVGTLLQTCNACHSIYQISTEAPKARATRAGK